jgi:signal peptidase II
MEKSSRTRATFWAIIVVIVVADIVTKWWAHNSLGPIGVPHPVFGDWFRWTLVYNRGAAFGLHVGEYSRWVFLVLTMVALFILGRLYIESRPTDRARLLAIALVCGGALGNLYDRVRWANGVVDFIDIGVGTTRWPTFNIADMAVSTGAFLLAYVLWGEDSAAASSKAAADGEPVKSTSSSAPDKVTGTG